MIRFFELTMLVRAGALASVWAALSGAAAAAPSLTPEALREMTPEQARAAVLKQVEWQRARRQQGGANQSLALDVTPPELTKFEAKGPVDLGNANNRASAEIIASDDLSGVNYLYAYAYGPSGQYVSVNMSSYYPSRKVKAVAGDYASRGFLMPGTYVYDYAYVSDAAGNYSYYDAAALAALGTSSFEIENTSGYDTVAPSLVSGKVLTKSVSLSGTAPGTDRPPYLGVSLSIKDTSNDVVSGVQSGYVQFCLSDLSHCLYLYGYLYATQLGQVELKVGRPLDPEYDPVGDYLLYSVEVDDNARNYRYYYSDKFGGETDFSKYFPSTVIKVKP